jgi:hypothetical protein
MAVFLRRKQSLEGKVPPNLLPELERLEELGSRLAVQRKKKKRVRKSTVEEGIQIVESMVSSGALLPHEESQELEREKRRAQVWDLHLKGVNKSVIASFFGVSEVTIYNDIRSYNVLLQGELARKGPAGIIADAFAYYDLLKGEAIKLYEQVDEPEVDTNGSEILGKRDRLEAIKTKAGILRLARDVEESKNRLFMSIGVLARGGRADVSKAMTSALSADVEMSNERVRMMLDELSVMLTET